MAYAGATIGSDDVVNDSLRSVDLMDDAGVRTQDVVDDTDATGGLTAPDLRPESVGGSEVVPNSLTGSDIQEGTLGLVPEARLGGIGRSTSFPGVCNPEANFFVTCDFVRLEFPDSPRVLILGQVAAVAEPERNLAA